MKQVNNTAYLYNKGEYTFFKIDREIIKFATSPYLSSYKRVKEYDNGYIVVDAEYIMPDDRNKKYIEEDYIDIQYTMNDLGLNDKILGVVKEVKIL